MNSIYTERENILPHHAEWLDGCGATWVVFETKFSTGVNARMGNIIFNGMKQNGFSHAYDPDINYIHIPTGSEFCERVAEILGLEKPVFEQFGNSEQVDISKKETTTDHIPYVGQKVDEHDKLFPGRNNTMGEGSLTQEDIEILLGDSIVKSIKGMAIEVSRLGQADREWVVEVRNELCNWHMWKYCIYKEGRIKLGDVLDKDLTITESPTEFLEYVGKQTGKEYKKTAAYDVQKFVANREGMAERLAKAPFTNEELMDLPAEEIGKLNLGKPELKGMAIEVSRLSEEYKPMNNHQAVTSGTNDGLDDGPKFEDIAKALGVDDDSWKLRKPTYPHKTYRILDSLDGIPLDKRIPLSEWIPPMNSRVEVIAIASQDLAYHGYYKYLQGDCITFHSFKLNRELTLPLDGHWMRIV